MKKQIILLCLFALALTACNKPEMPSDDNTPQDTIVPQETDTLVKKYLTKVYGLSASGTEEIWKAIEWNEDHSKIEKVVFYPGTHLEEGYDFEYFGEDSICEYCITSSGSLHLRYVYYLNDGRIVKYRIADSMNPFACTTYEYDDCGHLTREQHFDSGASQPTFGKTIAYEWEGENVRLIWNADTGDTLEYYSDFYECISSEYTTPFMFRRHYYDYLTRPLWRNCNGRYLRDSWGVKCDEDGYVSEMYHTNDIGETGAIYYAYEK